MKRLPKTQKGRRQLCENICDLARQGLSRSQIAASLDIQECRLSSWAADCDIIAEGLADADCLELAWWETLGQKLARDGGGQASTYAFIMKNRFPSRYRDAAERRINLSSQEHDSALIAGVNALDDQTCKALRALLEKAK